MPEECKEYNRDICEACEAVLSRNANQWPETRAVFIVMRAYGQQNSTNKHDDVYRHLRLLEQIAGMEYWVDALRHKPPPLPETLGPFHGARLMVHELSALQEVRMYLCRCYGKLVDIRGRPIASHETVDGIVRVILETHRAQLPAAKRTKK